MYVFEKRIPSPDNLKFYPTHSSIHRTDNPFLSPFFPNGAVFKTIVLYALSYQPIFVALYCRFVQAEPTLDLSCTQL